METDERHNLSPENWQEEYIRRSSRIEPLSTVISNYPRPSVLIPGLLPDKVLTMISAEPFSGKSMLCLAMALSLASGRALWGGDPHSSGTLRPILASSGDITRRVPLFLGQDAPSWDYAEQLRKLCRGYNLERVVEELEMDLQLNQGGNLLDPHFLTLLQDWHSQIAFDCVFIDTLQAFHTASENDAQQMGVIMTILKRIRDRFSCPVIFTHHTRKPTPGEPEGSLNYAARGSSVIAGSIDFHLTLKRQGDSNRILIRMPKGRGGAPLTLKSFDIQELETPNGPAVKLLANP